MSTKKHYEEYWAKKRKKEDFFNYERNWILSRLFKKGESVLDLGCGDGVVAEYLQNELGNKVVGVDISKKALEIARKRGVKTRLMDVEDELPFKKEKFDSVFWGDNVEHLFNPQIVLKEIRRILKKDGRLILSCPNIGYWRYRVHFLLKGKLPDTEWTGNPSWNWSHIRFFNLRILKNFLRSEDFKFIKALGVNRRFPDKYLVNLSSSIFSMILVVEAKKNV